jgi:hypothetical protein
MANDHDDEPPQLRVVSDNPNARSNREIAWTREEVERTLSQFGAALLRTMAGNDTEATYLMHRLSDFIATLSKFQEKAGRGITIAELQKVLRLPQAEYKSSDDEWHHRRWLRKHGMETIVKGALRLAAHKILREEPAFGGKHSEDVIEQGIKTLEELKRPARVSTPELRQKKKGLVRGWDDVDRGSAEVAGEPKRRFGERLDRSASERPTSRGAASPFNQNDLKELRKAMKANDKKRIAELTAKIGKRPLKD